MLTKTATAVQNRRKTLVLALLRKQNVKSPVRVRALNTIHAPSVKSPTDQQELLKLWSGVRLLSGAPLALQSMWNATYSTTLQALGDAQQRQLLSDTQHLPRALLHNYHQSHQHCLEDLVHSVKKIKRFSPSQNWETAIYFILDNKIPQS